MKKLLLALSVLFSSMALQAAESKLFKSLASGNFQELRNQAFIELKEESSLARKREILSTLAAHRDKLYDLSEFDGKILSFNSGSCAQAEHEPIVCSTESGFEYLLSQAPEGQLLSVRKGNQTLLTYSAHSRSAVAETALTFGKAIHLIVPKKKRNGFYFLIREIEGERSRSVSITQTINVFLVREGQVCRIAEGDGETESHYTLIEEFVRTLGPNASCGQPVIRI